MDAAVVLVDLDEVVHVPGLGIIAEHVIVVGGPWLLERAQRPPGHARREDLAADEPVRLVDGLLQLPLLDERRGRQPSTRSTRPPGLVHEETIERERRDSSRARRRSVTGSCA